MQFKHFGKKLLKFLKNPKLAISAAYRYYMYIHGDELKTPLSCEGLISSPEAFYLYKTALGNRKKEGAILDFGSYKGLSTCILSWAGMKIGKSIIAFEWFQGLPSPSVELEGDFFKEGEYKASKFEFEKNINKWGRPENIKLVVGDCRETLSEEIKTGRINEYSFAFIDVDLYDVIKDILVWLDNISRGGEIICIHDIHSPGVELAIEEFIVLSKHKVSIRNILNMSKITVLRLKNENRKRN